MLILCGLKCAVQCLQSSSSSVVQLHAFIPQHGRWFSGLQLRGNIPALYDINRDVDPWSKAGQTMPSTALLSVSAEAGAQAHRWCPVRCGARTDGDTLQFCYAYVQITNTQVLTFLDYYTSLHIKLAHPVLRVASMSRSSRAEAVTSWRGPRLRDQTLNAGPVKASGRLE